MLTLIDKIKISTPFDMRINADANINVSQLPINQQYREGLKKNLSYTLTAKEKKYPVFAQPRRINYLLFLSTLMVVA